MIYIHIPFCRTRCVYCGFYSELPCRTTGGSGCASNQAGNLSAQWRFVEALCREMEGERVQTDCLCGRKAPDTVYIGGGTPSLLGVEELEKLVAQVNCLRKRSGLDGAPEEFTIEVNPDDMVRGGDVYAAGLRRLGVNRVSMGVQSFDDAVLKKMGRRHSSAEAVEAFRILRKAGFDNISIDLIFGFSPQLDTGRILEGFAAFGSLPEHISCYQLSIEQGSGLEKMLERGLLTLPSDEECVLQYDSLCSLLRQAGYRHYEISNWALPGRESRHNSAYWNHSPYLGLGPGAHSLEVSSGVQLSEAAPGTSGEIFRRRWNRPDLGAYLKAASDSGFEPVREGEVLDEEQVREEKIMLGLRTAEGVELEVLGGPAANSVAKDMSVRGLLARGLLEKVGQKNTITARLRIPESKWFISDSITASLI